MDTTKLKSIKKKKRIYSKIKEPIIYSKSPLKNNMQTISFLYKTNNIWSHFIDNVIYQQKYELIKLPIRHNLLNILNEIENPYTKKQIIKILMNDKKYNPYFSQIPLSIFPKNLFKYILKKQLYILKFFNTKDTIKKHNLKICICYRNKNINIQEMFKEKYDLIILFNSSSISFHINNKDIYDLNILYEKLAAMEKDVWYLHGNNKLLKTQRNRKTKINYDYIVKEMI